MFSSRSFANNVTGSTFIDVVKPYSITITKHNYLTYVHTQDIYIQNYSFTDNSLITGRNISTGSNVVIKNGSGIIFKPEQVVTIGAGFEVEPGGAFEIRK